MKRSNGQREGSTVMADARLGATRLGWIVGLLALTVGVGLGSSGRLTYHEAFVAQAAREMVAKGFGTGWLVPTVGGQTWLEKPPLLIWAVASLGLALGGVTEWSARIPSALAAAGVALGVALLAARRFGPTVGLLAGLIQASTGWIILRGRLGEADIVLAAIVTGLMVAFDRLRMGDIKAAPADPSILRGPHRSTAARPLAVAAASGNRPYPGIEIEGDSHECRGLQIADRKSQNTDDGPLAICNLQSAICDEFPESASNPDLTGWRWAFFGLLGATALVKGIGFGAALMLPATVAVLAWDRDRSAIRHLLSVRGAIVAATLALAWPIAVSVRVPEALSLWTMHVTDRFASHPEHFIGGPRWQYLPAVLLQAMPWTPLALLGMGPSLVRAWRDRGGGDRLLWAWAVVPVLVLSAATIKNAHYAIHALPPWSIWAALGLVRVARILGRRPWWTPPRIRRAGVGLFATLGLATAFGYLFVAPRLDARGREWAYCEAIGRTLDPHTPLVCLYEDWDRKPYATPFGPVPHDWAIRLFSFERPATWRQGVPDLIDRPLNQPFALLARDRDRPALNAVGKVEVISKGPSVRFDRTFTLFWVTPKS